MVREPESHIQRRQAFPLVLLEKISKCFRFAKTRLQNIYFAGLISLAVASHVGCMDFLESEQQNFVVPIFVFWGNERFASYIINGRELIFL